MSHIYADANTTAPMPPEAIDAWVGATNQGDPLEGSVTVAKHSLKAVDKFRAFLGTEAAVAKDEFRFLHATGREDANIMILESCVHAALLRAKKPTKPHVVIGFGVARSMHQYLRRMQSEGRCLYNVIWPDPQGTPCGSLTPRMIERAIRPNTCLVTVSAVTPEGILNNLFALGKACFAPENSKGVCRRIPIHVDVSVLHPRTAIAPNMWGIDAYTIDSARMGGAQGFGILAIRTSLCMGYKLSLVVENRPLNAMAMASMHAAMRIALTDRDKKNAALESITQSIIRVLETAAASTAGKKLYWFPERLPSTLKVMIDELRDATDAKEYGEVTKKYYGENCPARKLREPWVMILSPLNSALRMPNTLVVAIGNGATAVENKEVLEREHKVVCATIPNAAVRPSTSTFMSRSLVPAHIAERALVISLPDGATKKQAQGVAMGLAKLIEDPDEP